VITNYTTLLQVTVALCTWHFSELRK